MATRLPTDFDSPPNMPWQQNTAAPPDPYMSGASRFLPQMDFDPFQQPQAAFSPNYSYFYDPQNFLEQTPQPRFGAPFFHVSPGQVNPGGPFLPGPQSFPYPMEQPGAPLTDIPMLNEPVQPVAGPQGEWIQHQGGGMHWVGPEGYAWKSPAMENQVGGGAWKVDPTTGVGVNQFGDPIRVDDGRVVPNQGSLANTWVQNQAGGMRWIGPQGYAWRGPEMQSQIGAGEGMQPWRINPDTGYGTNQFGNQILVKGGIVNPFGG